MCGRLLVVYGTCFHLFLAATLFLFLRLFLLNTRVVVPGLGFVVHVLSVFSLVLLGVSFVCNVIFALFLRFLLLFLGRLVFHCFPYRSFSGNLCFVFFYVNGVFLPGFTPIRGIRFGLKLRFGVLFGGIPTLFVLLVRCLGFVILFFRLFFGFL